MTAEERSDWRWKEGPIGRLIKVGYLALRKEMQDLLKPTGLTHSQWSALAILRHYPGIASSELEHILMIERPSVTSLMNGLAKRGLVTRRDDPEDGRYKRLYLTEAGKQLADQTRHFAEEVERKVIAAMGESDIAALKSLLIRMVESLEKS